MDLTPRHQWVKAHSQCSIRPVSVGDNEPGFTEMHGLRLDLINVMVDGMNDYGYRLWLIIISSDTLLSTASNTHSHGVVSNRLIDSTCTRFTSRRESVPSVDLYENFLTSYCLLRTFVGFSGKAQRRPRSV